MHDRAMLGRVDLPVREHLRDALRHPLLVREGDQQAQRLVVDALLGIVEQHPAAFEREAPRAIRIGREKLGKTRLAQVLIVGFELSPGLGSGGRGHCRFRFFEFR